MSFLPACGRQAEAGIQVSPLWIPTFAEILLRVIILQLVCLLSVNRGEVIVVTPEMSN
jgi:hypothetical protein